MKVLITGGAGFIGHNLIKNLLHEDAEVYAVDNFLTGKKENISGFLNNKNFHFFQLDISTQRFKKVFDGLEFDRIYHLACPTGVPNIHIMGEEMIHACSFGTFNVLDIAKKSKAKLLFSSSCEVYGQPEVFPQTEMYTGNVDHIGSRSPYEEGKRFSETILKFYTRKYNVDAKIVRFFNIYGPGMSLEDTRVLPKFFKSIKEGRSLEVYGDGSQTRTFLYIDDLLKGLEIVMDTGKSGEAYNLGTDRQISISDLAELVLKISRADSKIEYVPHFISDHKDRLPSLEKICNLGWRQSVALEDGLKKMTEYYGMENIKEPENAMLKKPFSATAGEVVH